MLTIKYYVTDKRNVTAKYNRFVNQLKPTYLFMKRYHIPTIKYIKMQLNSAHVDMSTKLRFDDKMIAKLSK